MFAGLLLAPSSAAGMMNLIYLPLALCGGLWMPLEVLPEWLQGIAPLLPSYHFSRLALHTLGYFNESEGRSWAMLAGYALVFALAGASVFRKQEASR
jgi:ABC-2 type transport system permease protein